MLFVCLIKYSTINSNFEKLLFEENKNLNFTTDILGELKFDDITTRPIYNPLVFKSYEALSSPIN